MMTSNADKDVEQQEHSYTAVGMQNGIALWKAIWEFLTEWNILLSYNPATALLDIYPKELKTMSTQNPAYECFLRNSNMRFTDVFLKSIFIFGIIPWLESCVKYIPLKQNSITSF